MKTTRKYYEIPERPEFKRDGHSKGLILQDQSVLRREKAKRMKQLEQDQLRQDVDKLTVKMDNIEKLLLQLIEKEKS